jgi:hypothetical protein
MNIPNDDGIPATVKKSRYNHQVFIVNDSLGNEIKRYQG